MNPKQQYSVTTVIAVAVAAVAVAAVAIDTLKEVMASITILPLRASANYIATERHFGA